MSSEFILSTCRKDTELDLFKTCAIEVQCVSTCQVSRLIMGFKLDTYIE